MTPFRRHVSLFMDKDIYKKLGNQPDTEKAWKLVRSKVGDELFQRDFVAVPQIESALYYNQLFVFKKRTDPCSILKLRAPRYRITSNLDNLLNIDFSTWIPRFDFSPWNSYDAMRIFPEFRLVLESREDENVAKSIEVVVKEPHVRNASPPIQGATVLKEVTTKAYVLYVVTSVVFANYVKISVSIDSEQSVFIKENVIPIGFKYKKYKVSSNGYLSIELPTTLKFTDKEAVWLQPNDVPLLRRSLWDPLRRWHDGRRPDRNILTMTTPAWEPQPILLPPPRHLGLPRPREGGQDIYRPLAIMPNYNVLVARNNNINQLRNEVFTTDIDSQIAALGPQNIVISRNVRRWFVINGT